MPVLLILYTLPRSLTKPNQEASKINVFIIFSQQLGNEDDSPPSGPASGLPPPGMLQP